jgi:hypothetical protein
MKYYLAGPMRGYPDFNFPMFDRVTAHLRSIGDEVVSPAEHDRETYPDIETWEGYTLGNTSLCPEFSLREALLWDLTQIMECDGIVLLPGWEKSSGAAVEHALARALGLEVWEFDAAVLEHA